MPTRFGQIYLILPLHHHAQIVMVATKGDDKQGYVAVDGFFFDDSPLLPNCPLLPPDADVNHPTTPPNPPPIQDCNFEVDFCTWHTVPVDEGGETFVWRRTTGSEHNNVDGPEANHDGKKDSKEPNCYNSCLNSFVFSLVCVDSWKEWGKWSYYTTSQPHHHHTVRHLLQLLV